MLLHINIEDMSPRYWLIVSVDEINCMLVINNNTCTFNQKTKMYFVDFYFQSKKTISFMTMVVCGLSNMISGMLIVYVTCD
jgi:hypothetical protein